MEKIWSSTVKKRYPDVKDVRLIWHFLAFDKEIDSTRTDEELDALKKNTIQLINVIESEEKYPTKPSRLCDWCEFKSICKNWSHLYKLEDKPVNEYLNDDGVKLVNRYAELQNQKKQIKLDLYAEIEKLEEAIIHYAKKESIDVVFGSNNKVKVKLSERYACPSKHSKEREKLEQLLRKHGKWDEVAQLDTTAINKIIQDKKWDNKIIDALEEYVKLEQSKRLYLSKITAE